MQAPPARGALCCLAEWLRRALPAVRSQTWTPLRLYLPAANHQLQTFHLYVPDPGTHLQEHVQLRPLQGGGGWVGEGGVRQAQRWGGGVLSRFRKGGGNRWISNLQSNHRRIECVCSRHKPVSGSEWAAAMRGRCGRAAPASLALSTLSTQSRLGSASSDFT